MSALAASRRSRAARTGWLVVICAFTVLPLAIIVVASFSTVSYGAWPPPGYSLQWYRNLWEQPGLVEATSLSLRVALATTVVTGLLGLGVSVAIVRYTFLGRRLTRGLTFAPLVVPKVALGFALFIYLNRLGVFDAGTLGLVAAHVIITLPFVSTLLSAALVRADRSVEEAAMDLGASPVRAFWAVTLPQIRPALIATGLFVFVLSFDEVDASVFVLPIDRQTLPVWMYQYMQRFQDPTLAALSTVLIAASLLLAVLGALALRRSGVLATLLRNR
ncbi:MAG: ABC transporter permease [Natronosporangium sp.]